jgi:hypothetical protein
MRNDHLLTFVKFESSIFHFLEIYLLHFCKKKAANKSSKHNVYKIEQKKNNNIKPTIYLSPIGRIKIKF